MGRNALLKLDKSRRQVRLSKPRVAVLGDESGNIYDRDTGMYLLRYLGTADENGKATYGPVFRAFGGQVNFIEQAYRQVKVITNDEGQKEIVGPVWRDLQQADIKPYTTHPNTAYRQFTRLADIQNFMAKPVNRNSMKVRVGELFYVDRFGVPQFFPGTNAATHIDLTSYIPATADFECVVLISFDQDAYSTSTPPYFTMTTSTPQTSLPSTLGLSDVREAYTGRTAYSMPVQVYRLYNGMTGLKEDMIALDNRQVYNVPATVANPNPIIITSEDDSVTVTEGPVGTWDLSATGGGGMASFTLQADSGPDQTVDGVDPVKILGGTGLSSVASAPDTLTLNLDNTITGGTAAYPASITYNDQGQLTNVTAGSAPGTMSSFKVGADTGADETVANNQLVDFLGGDGIETSVSAPRTVYMGIMDQGVNNDKIADNTIEPSKLADGNPYSVLGTDDTGVFDTIPNGDIVVGVLGETCSQSAFVIQKPDGLWYKANATYASLSMAEYGRRGVLLYGTAYTSGSTVRIMRRGFAYNFTGLTAGAVMYASTTAGAYTLTEPTPALDSTIAVIAPWGRGWAANTMWVDAYQPITYRAYKTMADGGTAALTHHPNVPTQTRTINARTYAYDETIIEQYASSNQDASKQLRGQSGAGALVTVDTAGANLAALGDNGGNEFMVAQSVTLTAGTLSQVTFVTGASVGTPSGPATIELRTNNAGNPSATVLYTGTQAITASSAITHTITGGPFVDAGLYWIVISVPAQATNSRFSVQYSSTNPYASGQMKSDSSASAGTWAVALTGGASADLRCTVTTAAQAANDALAQGTSHSSTAVLTSVSLWLRKVGNPTGSLKVSIYSNSGGLPNTLITNGDSSTVLASSLSTSYAFVNFLFPLNPSLSASTQYHIVLTTTDSASNTNYVEWGIDTSSPSYANGVLSVLNPTWAAASPAADGCFQLFAQGTQFEEDLQLGQWTGGIGQYGVRRGDSSGANKSTVTQLMNISGASLIMISDVSVP